MSVAALAQAAEQTLSFDIPAGALQPAVLAFAQRANVSVNFEPRDLAGKQTAGLRGSHTVAAGLRLLLEGSGLGLQFVSTGVYSLSPKAAEAKAAQAAVPSGAATELPPLYVQSADSDGVLARRSSTATRTDTPLAETPLSISVVTRTTLEQQQSQSITDALRNAAGVGVVSDSLNGVGTGKSVNIRGFSAPVYVDGSEDEASRTNIGSSGLTTPIAAIERIEVVKGADAVLGGANHGSGAGGQVNVVLKKPQAEPVRSVSLETGSYGHVQGALDLAGPLSEDKRWTYRLVTSVQNDRSSWGGYDGARSRYLAPSLAFKDGTDAVLVGLRANSARTVFERYTYVNTVTGEVAEPLQPSGNSADHGSSETYTLFAEWEREAAGWQVVSKVRYTKGDSRYGYYTFVPSARATELLNFYPIAGHFKFDNSNAEVSASRSFTSGAFQHKLLLGGSIQKYLISGSGGMTGAALKGDRNIVRPPVADYTGEMPTSRYYDSNLFVQDQIKFGNWTALASIARGAEWGRYRDSQVSRQSAYSPSLGVLYQLNETVGLFANAKRGFSPQPDTILADGSLAPPRRDQSVDLGTKVNLLDDRLSLNVALFRSSIKNSLYPDYSIGAYVLYPDYSSKGLELELAGKPSPNLETVVAYTYMTIDTLPGESRRMPRNRLRLYADYTFSGPDLQGWSVGGGVTANSGFVASGSTTELKSQSAWEASVGYRQKSWRLLAGVKNLFNQRLYGDYSWQSRINVLPGRVATLTGTYDF